MAEDVSIGPRVARALGGGVALSGVLLAAGLCAPAPWGAQVIGAGIAVLVATPIARVLLLTYAYGRRRDWGLMGAGLAVMAMLALSALLGRTHG